MNIPNYCDVMNDPRLPFRMAGAIFPDEHPGMLLPAGPFIIRAGEWINYDTKLARPDVDKGKDRGE